MILVLAAVFFLLRGPLRARSDYVNDFAAPYACGRLWMQGQNPYDPAAFFPAWRAAKAPQGKVYANPSSVHPVYPPPSILVLLPLSLLPWPVASVVLTLITTLAYVSAAVLFTTLVPGSWGESLKPIFLAYALALAPTHSAIHVSNLACLSASLLFLALYRLLQESPDAGLFRSEFQPPVDLVTASLLVLSLCLKPTLPPLVLLFLVTQRRWKTLAATLSLGLMSVLVSLYPLLREGSQWYKDLRSNIQFVFTLGSANLSEINLTRFDRIDLQLPLYAITRSRTTADVLATGISLVLLLAWLRVSRDRPESSFPAPGEPDTSGTARLDDRLFTVSTLLLIGLLPFYQRFYSAMLLLPLALWSFRTLSRRASHWALALCGIFLVNTEVLQQKLGIVPAGAHHLSFLQNALIGPHLNWLLLISAIVLLLPRLRDRLPREQRSARPAKTS